MPCTTGMTRILRFQVDGFAGLALCAPKYVIVRCKALIADTGSLRRTYTGQEYTPGGVVQQSSPSP
jgi:hypothetical protein